MSHIGNIIANEINLILDSYDNLKEANFFEIWEKVCKIEKNLNYRQHVLNVIKN